MPRPARRPLTALLVLLAALAAVLSGVATPPPAQAAPNTLASEPPTWQNVGPINLALTHGARYVSQSDVRWGEQHMSSNPKKTYDACACILAGMRRC